MESRCSHAEGRPKRGPRRIYPTRLVRTNTTRAHLVAVVAVVGVVVSCTSPRLVIRVGEEQRFDRVCEEQRLSRKQLLSRLTLSSKQL
jgi:hypothetical protein